MTDTFKKFCEYWPMVPSNDLYIAANIFDGYHTYDEILERSINAKKWHDSCYNKPSLAEIQMCALDHLLEGFGIESTSIIDGNCIEYINMGDTYNTTVLKEGSHMWIGCWGDWVEDTENEVIQEYFGDLSLSDRVEICNEANISIFQARNTELHNYDCDFLMAIRDRISEY